MVSLFLACCQNFCILILLIWNSYTKCIYNKVNETKRHYRKSRAPTAVTMSSICANIRRITTPKHLNWSSQKLVGVIRCWIALWLQKFCSDRFSSFWSPITWFPSLLVWQFYFAFLRTWIRIMHILLHGLLRKICQQMSYQVRNCILGVTVIIFITKILKVPKNRQFLLESIRNQEYTILLLST